ncbi:hypothetical protein Pint_06030 [Pistacia integerrima]|uniref:Uncharacterized protein n=1 Tax=Pistacia integerrima TaxID=434235 RepID=A0ACC0Z9G5_9ROSI|nr:hypothetical protein Pint_06030 [Pistacia integerrima]
MAEKARLAVYKVCWNGGYCMESDILAGLDKAVEDGVDLISISLGNSGFRAETVDNVAPWMITVGASTIDRKFPADVVLEDGTTYHTLYNGKQLPNKTYFPLIYAGSACMYGSLDPKLIHGKIVVCDRGDIGCVDKGNAVKKAGGIGVIVANTESSGEGLIADAHLFPGLAITLSAREKGVDILAAWTNDSSPSGCLEDTRRAEFNIISGTSTSCPHVSGLAALLKAAHLDWSPAMIKSALTTTAYTQDEDAEDYIDFLCESNYSLDHIQIITRRSVNCSSSKIKNPWDLNYPIISVGFGASKSSNSEVLVTTRTVTYVSETASRYKVRIINPEGVTVTVDIS